MAWRRSRNYVNDSGHDVKFQESSRIETEDDSDGEVNLLNAPSEFLYSGSPKDIYLKTSANSDENVSRTMSKNNTKLDKFLQVQNDETFWRLDSEDSRGNTFVEDRKKEIVFEVPLEIFTSNKIDPINQNKENVHSSIRKEECVFDKEDRSIFPENFGSKNSGSFVEPHILCHSFEDDLKENLQFENKHPNDTYLQFMTSIPINIPLERIGDNTHNRSIQEDTSQCWEPWNESEEMEDTKRSEKIENEDEFDEEQENVKFGVYNGNREENQNGEFTKQIGFISQSNTETNIITNTSTSSISFLNDSEENSENECETRMSVNEIRRRFSFHTENKNELVKLSNTSESLEMKERNTPNCSQHSKDHVQLEGTSGMCTTELYISSAGKDSPSASCLSATGSGSGILSDDKLVKTRRNSFHSGMPNDTEEFRSTSEGLTNDSLANKMSVKQLKERLITSCSDIIENISESKRYAKIKPIGKSYSFDENAEVPIKACENQNFNVCVKEIMKTYKCQLSKAHQNIKSLYTEQDAPAVSSIKELQSSFNKSVEQNTSPVNCVNSSKIKVIHEGIAQMQNYSMKCKSCAKQVFFMERVLAEKATWHKKCFKCRECQKQLTVENYKSHDGELYCQSHYTNILKPKPNDETVSAYSAIEEVKIPPLNIKPLFEKTQNITPPISPSKSPLSFQRSPKFLKRLAKFEGKYQGESEDEEDEKENTNEESKNISCEKRCIAKDFECSFQGMIKSSDTDSRFQVKSCTDGSPESSTLQAHLKQFFEKSSEDQSLISTAQTFTDAPVSINQNKCIQMNNSLKVPCTQVEEKNLEDIQANAKQIALHESDSKYEEPISNESEVSREIKKVGELTHDVQYVISYFNQQK